MDSRFSPKTSQKADVRPISFVLDNLGSLGDPITLPVRPEDLTRNESARATVHQTLGKGVQGWVDHFGEGLPSVSIAGHTGWGYKPGLGRDGFESFEVLNDLIVHRYPEALQQAAETGRDPSSVKLLFVDMLDNFAWEVVPTQFVLRRSKSRPLLFQYNINLQAVSTQVDGGLARFLPNLGSISGGLGALDTILGKFAGFTDMLKGALGGLKAIAGNVTRFVNSAVNVIKAVRNVVSATTGFITGAAGLVIGIAKAISMAGREVFRTLAAIASIPRVAKAALSQIGAAFHEVVCIFSNSLRPRGQYEQFDGLYGASNCSSTTGGRMPGAFSNQNVFALMNEKAKAPVTLSGAAISSVNSIVASDPVLSPMPPQEIARHLDIITAGTVVAA